ncbi:unnamed protein product [Pleuronectes platessa]|uniref:Uncharacterized protein n=1 Tax=Pleuronectes platessa TaxID=8262 RepID=A0A9N7YCD7_PLEPL|nr:unnamed protein product [Pleuronectes platessa]
MAASREEYVPKKGTVSSVIWNWFAFESCLSHQQCFRDAEQTLAQPRFHSPCCGQYMTSDVGPQPDADHSTALSHNLQSAGRHHSAELDTRMYARRTEAQQHDENTKASMEAIAVLCPRLPGPGWVGEVGAALGLSGTLRPSLLPCCVLVWLFELVQFDLADCLPGLLLGSLWYLGSDKSSSHCALPGASQAARSQLVLPNRFKLLWKTALAATSRHPPPSQRKGRIKEKQHRLPQEDCDLLLPQSLEGVSTCHPVCLG